MSAGVPGGEFASHYVKLEDFMCCFAKPSLYRINATGCDISALYSSASVRQNQRNPAFGRTKEERTDTLSGVDSVLLTHSTTGLLCGA